MELLLSSSIPAVRCVQLHEMRVLLTQVENLSRTTARVVNDSNRTPRISCVIQPRREVTVCHSSLTWRSPSATPTRRAAQEKPPPTLTSPHFRICPVAPGGPSRTLSHLTVDAADIAPIAYPCVRRRSGCASLCRCSQSLLTRRSTAGGPCPSK